MTLVGRAAEYYKLTKPSIMFLVLFTGATSLVVEGSFLTDPLKFFLVLVGLFLTGGCANALNQFLERDLDAVMTRTRLRRPLPTGRITATEAIVFSIIIGVIGVWLFAWFFNILTALLSVGTILFYSLVYTLWLKPNTPQNIVIGGIAGAMAPIGAWTAATGNMSIIALIMFLLIFLWTPPHFWALALYSKEDYRKVNLPMMPLVKGDSATFKLIIRYTFVLFAVSLTPIFFSVGYLYLATAVILGAGFIWFSFKARKLRTTASLKSLFGFSLLYLFGVFTAMIADQIMRHAGWHNGLW